MPLLLLGVYLSEIALTVGPSAGAAFVTQQGPLRPVYPGDELDTPQEFLRPELER